MTRQERRKRRRQRRRRMQAGIRNLYFHQRQKEAAEWQRKKERLRPRRKSNRDI